MLVTSALPTLTADRYLLCAPCTFVRSRVPLQLLAKAIFVQVEDRAASHISSSIRSVLHSSAKVCFPCVLVCACVGKHE